jgi:hypothetical protein
VTSSCDSGEPPHRSAHVRSLDEARYESLVDIRLVFSLDDIRTAGNGNTCDEVVVPSRAESHISKAHMSSMLAYTMSSMLAYSFSLSVKRS